jgi:hypothetical protein
VPRLIVAIEQRSGIACETSVAAVDGLAVDVVAVQRLLVVTADEDRLDGTVGRAGVSECPGTRRFHPRGPVSTGKAEDALGAA